MLYFLFLFLNATPSLNNSNKRSKHLYQSDHVVISIGLLPFQYRSQYCVSILFCVVCLHMLQLASHELLPFTRASGASFIGIFSSQKFWLSRDLLLFELRKWFPEKRDGIDAVHFLGHIRRLFWNQSAILPFYQMGVPADLYDKVAVSSARSLIVGRLRMRQLRCISHGVQVFLMTADPLIIQWIVGLTFFIFQFHSAFFFFSKTLGTSNFMRRVNSKLTIVIQTTSKPYRT